MGLIAFKPCWDSSGLCGVASLHHVWGEDLGEKAG